MSHLQYFNLSIPAPQRLTMMRADFATHAAKYPNCPENYKPRTWRDVRAWGFHNWQSAFGCLSQGEGEWYSHNGPEFREERDSGEVVNLRHSGWFTDSEGRNTAVGLVIRLNHGRFISGYRWTDNGERVYYPEIFTDEREAARMGDEHARVFAEHAREDSERFDAMALAEIKCEDSESELRDAWGEYRAAQFAFVRSPSRFFETARKARERVRECIEGVRESREEYETARASYETGGR